MNANSVMMLLAVLAVALSAPVLADLAHAQTSTPPPYITPPGAPSAVSSVEVVDHGSDYITIKITPPTGSNPVSHYEVLYTPADNCVLPDKLHTVPIKNATACKYDTGSNNLTITVPRLLADTTYKLYPVAANNVGIGPTLFLGEQKTNDTITPPGTPTGLKADHPTASTMQLEWKAPKSTGGGKVTYVVQYRLHAYDYPYFPPLPPAPWTTMLTGSVQPLYKVLGLTASTVYDFRVKAVSTGGESDWSNIVWNRTTDATRPGVPNLKASNPGTSTMDLNWTLMETGGSPIRDHNVEFREHGGDWRDYHLPERFTGTFVTVTELRADTLYEFRVAAANDYDKDRSLDWGDWSTLTEKRTRSG